ncbi:MAG: SAM-dependent methyltransferase [Thermodesulfobacteriota bacterium]|jgi:precorrin-4 methylase|nr:MAG: SAM-dependent methyltransferase [Thermodesulfobacteriota bacterium]
MRKKIMVLFSLAFLLLVGVKGWAGVLPVLSVTGMVQQPLFVTLQDLENMQSLFVRYNEVANSEGHSEGDVYFRGVPLKNLLELACVQKDEDANFFKPIDLAIVVKNKKGSQTVLSWGEVLDHNPGDVVIALSTIHAKNPKVDTGAEGAKSPMGFPKLVIANDIFPDRSLNEVSQIEVLKVASGLIFKKTETLSSSEVTVTGAVKNTFTLKNLSDFPRIDVDVKQRGEGNGTPKLKKFSGVSVRKLIEKAGVASDPNTVFLVSDPDGYRSLISYGELFFNLLGERRLIIADTADNHPLEKSGKFAFVAPDGLSAGRWVKAVSKIEAITIKPHAKLYIMGMGCGDTSLLTMDTLFYLARADVFICPDEMKTRFARYIGEKPILFNHKDYMEWVFKKNHPELSQDELQKSLKAERDKVLTTVKDALAQGKNVAFLDYGDPTIFGTCWRWLKASLPDEDTKIVPGLSAFNASNALTGRDVSCKGTIVVIAPDGFKNNEALIKAIADKGETMAIFMGLREMPNLMPTLQKYYPEATPAAIAYNSGRKEKETLVRTTLGDLPKVVEKESEKSMGVIYIGGCLENDVKGYHFN